MTNVLNHYGRLRGQSAKRTWREMSINESRATFVFVSCIILVIFAVALGGCTGGSGLKPEDCTCDKLVAWIDFTNFQSAAVTGNVYFTVNYVACSSYLNQSLWITVIKPDGSTDYSQDYTISSYGPNTLTQTCSYFFSTPGIYTIWAAATTGASGKPNGSMQSPRYQITIKNSTNNSFHIIQLEMINDALWPNYIDATNNISYIGAAKRGLSRSSW
jgi:hypothetical protein